MRLLWVVVVGISALACKDKQAPSQQAARTAPAEPAPPSTPERSLRPAAPPSLDPTRDGADQSDAAWANSTRAAIEAVAPELTDVTCRDSQCQGTLVAASETELVQLAERLQTPQSLRSTDATNILLTAPARVDGKLAMTIYVRYER